MKTLSIVIPFFNAVEYTNLCLESIFECTSGNFDIILIDNGSSEDERKKLEIYDGDQGLYKEIKIITNDINKGFPAAVNQGLAIAEGEYICILNNDLLVSPDWSEHLEWHLNHGFDVVGPRTNYIDGPQIIITDIYRNKQEYYQVAKEFYKQNRHKQWAFPRLVGFCLFLKREVYDNIGGFNEAYGIGNFEDDSWDLSAINAGYRLGIARDVYLHHWGTVTHKLLGLDYVKLLKKNQKIFESEWPADKVKELNEKNKEAVHGKK